MQLLQMLGKDVCPPVRENHSMGLYSDRNQRVACLHMQAYMIAGYDGTEVAWKFEEDEEWIGHSTSEWREIAFEDKTEIYHNGKKVAVFSTSCRGNQFCAKLIIGSCSYRASDSQPIWEMQ